ncbi:MAG: 5-formyltetrahydrofolate cyclo-ligase [Dechloromonas sp.]|uniref:5-formyltetrahydrofolate cyclo-ligase n=1 Tax=Candidatus Dechloromonas phosphorivorans TaxID=2899244 RepID=A0A9D7LRK3_9RHOO|nr:5-formyltetrahydrofolate cyclo-ligase [Candidatus Dechloromonas phosphorivorans]
MESRCEDITGWRQALRREMAARRTALASTEHAVLSARVVGHALAALARPTVAAFCWPIRNEPDVRALLARWAEDGVHAALPVVVAENAPLRFREWTPDGPLEADRYGIPTPTAGDWLTPDLILLPLNGFDGAGYRLGYGGGYFDRTLAALVPRPLAVGVGFEINRIDSIRPEPHDQRLDWIITEDGAFTPAA